MRTIILPLYARALYNVGYDLAETRCINSEGSACITALHPT